MIKHEQMMEGFDKFSDRIDRRYQEVRDCLNARRFEEAHQLLTGIAITHAHTSLSLRNLLIREGLLEDNK